MSIVDLVKMDCAPEVIRALATSFQRFGAADGAPEWLVSAVWLCTEESDFIASASAKVLADGHIAFPLAIDRPDEFATALDTELPDISGRLLGRDSDVELPVPVTPESPRDLKLRPEGPYSVAVLVRRAKRQSVVHRIACGLLFDFENSQLLIGTDVETLAMVLSDEPALIERYCAACECVPADDYLSCYAGRSD